MPEDIDDKRVYGPIIDTQITYIKPILCEPLYKEICFQISIGDLSPENEALMCYVRRVHKRYAFADLLRRQQLFVTKESVVRKISDESEFVDQDSINTSVRLYIDYAKTYAAELLQFLRDNKDDYPLWASCRCGCGSGYNHGCGNKTCGSYRSDVHSESSSYGFF